MVRDSAQQYAQSALAPRVKEAYRQESTDPNIFREMGEMGLSGRHDRWLRLPRCRLRLLRRDRDARSSASDSGYRSMMSVQVLSGDVPHLRLRHRGAAREIPP
jgi:glutaryl-CoA dehydrogenase